MLKFPFSESSTPMSLHFSSHSSWFYPFIYFKVQFVMQLEETVSKGDSDGKFIFPHQRVKSRQEGQLLAGGLLDSLGLFFFLKVLPSERTKFFSL